MTGRKWTEEKVEEAALPFQTRNEFRCGNPNAYAAARRMNILDAVCAHMDKVREDWTEEKVKKAALPFLTRVEFYRGNRNAHAAACRMGILDEVCVHMDKFFEDWTEEKVVEAALPFQTRNEFKRGNPKAYRAACRMKIIDDVCWHMEEVKGYNPYLKTRLYYYVIQMYVYIGITNDWESRHDQHLTNPNNEWTSRLAQCGMPTYFMCKDKHAKGYGIMEHRDRRVVERLERLAIRRAVSLGYWVVNKDYNPQFDPATGTYSWEKLAIAA